MIDAAGDPARLHEVGLGRHRAARALRPIARDPDSLFRIAHFGTMVGFMSDEPASPDMPSRHLSVVIAATADEVYNYAADPTNLPVWAAGLAESQVRREGDLLVADSPMGRVTVRFAPRNSFGVLDHDVTLPTGEVVTNPLRVLPHPDGAEVVFTIRRLGMTDEQFDADAAMVAADLARLKAVVESQAAR